MPSMGTKPTGRMGARRALVAAAIAFVTLAAGATAALTSRNAGTEMPAYIDIPAPHVGDRVAYDESFVGLEHAPAGWEGDQWRKSPAEPHPVASFEWRKGQPMADRHGTVYPTDRLEFSAMGNQSLWFATGTHQLVAETINLRSMGDQSGGNVPLLPEGGWSEGSFSINYGQDSLQPGCWYPVSKVPFLHAAQGRRLMTDQELRDAPPWCDQSVELHYSIFHAVAVDAVGGVRAVRWETERVAGGVQERIWLAPGIAYPVQMDWTYSSSGLFRRTITLTGFIPGSEPLGAAASGVAAPPLMYAPRKPWGLDDSGVAHPFPLSQAYELARSLPAFADLRDFLSKHPDAYTAHAHYQEKAASFVQGKVLREWRFSVTDGTEFLYLKVNQTDSSILDRSFPGGMRYAVSREADGWRPRNHAVLPDDLEKELPTVASLMARWPRYADSNWPAVGWAFSVDCYAKCNRPTSASIGGIMESSVGRVLDPSEGTVLSSTFANNARFLTFNSHDNWDAWQLDNRELGSTSHSPLAPAGAQAPANEPRRSVASLPAPAEVGSWPAGQMAGVTIAGLLAGALYYLWPAVKSGILALFSRVRPDRVRDHPQRGLILDAVEADPGIHFSQLQRRTGLANGTLLHHVRQLVQAGALAERRTPGYTCYFAGKPTQESLRQAPVLKSDGARRVLATIKASPGMSNLAVARMTGLAPSSVNAHIHRLVDAGLVTMQRNGREIRLSAAA